ncbi:MAG: ferritin [Salibacteraceae bacterium]|jgi:ferritin|nr:ferritin [Salibacteraceae bacterium]MDP4933218.1 ferritin [Salibacteraceae bacterium]
MLSKKVEEALNEQILMEGASSNFYLAMAVWAEQNGYSGVSDFLYKHSDEERFHMLKLVKYINERDGVAIIPAFQAPTTNYGSVKELFEKLYSHEVKVTQSIGELVGICLDERDFTTHNFLQWYVSEQLEEEALAKTIMDKIKLMGSDSGAWYHFDRDILSLTVTSSADSGSAAK